MSRAIGTANKVLRMYQIKQTLLANAILLQAYVESVGPDEVQTAGGLCYLLARGAAFYEGEYQSYDDVSPIITELYESWPEYSGKYGYPVPCPHGGCPCDAFVGGGDFMFAGEYGAARLRLLQFIIATLTKENT